MSKPWRILVTAAAMARSGTAALSRLREAGCELTLPVLSSKPSGAALKALLLGMDGVIASVEKYDSAVFSDPDLAQLKLISRWGVGFDSIDIPAASDAGILVAYTPGFLNETVADYSFSLLCALARRVHTGHLELSQGRWIPSWGHNIHGKTLGIVGCGRIGQVMARRASGFGMRILATDPQPSTEARATGVQYVSFEELLEQSDFISIHAASTPETRGMFNEQALRRMKPSAYLINTSRGALVEEVALAKALREGLIAGAALDTFVIEPLPKDHPFADAPNLLLTPHQASFTKETGALVSDAAAQAVLDAMCGKAPRFLVDPMAVQSPRLRLSLKSN